MRAHAHTDEAQLNFMTEQEAGESITGEEFEMIAGGQAVTNSI